MKRLHLLSNAHLDPVWQWQWQEGVGAAITTFSAAADFCEEFGDYIFCHNESVLYQWIEEYDPALFTRIQRLVKSGKWHIMGGWYLQPDCNMPSGESIIRQIKTGLDYFEEKFENFKRPDVAICFDAFGHSKGMVQILNDAGYRGYIAMRPGVGGADRNVIWKGHNGSELTVYRVFSAYNTLLGQVDKRLEPYLEHVMKDNELGLFLWGVGNHGGGPSRQDYKIIEEDMRKKYPDIQFIHSTPEAYFDEIESLKSTFPEVEEMNYCNMGAYTSMVRIKQLHQKLENALYSAEKMAVHAQLSSSDWEALKRAETDLLFNEFHDILPGTVTKSAEEDAIAMLSHGITEAERVRLKAFFKLTGGEKRAEPGEYPILVYHPHPFAAKRIVECEFMLADQNWSQEEFYDVEVFSNGKRIPCQIEKESSNIPLDWRKKLVFELEMKPFSVNRVSVFTKLKPVVKHDNTQITDRFVFENGSLRAVVDGKTGWLESLTVNGTEVLAGGLSLDVIDYCNDPWGFSYDDYRKKLGSYALLDSKEAARLAAAEVETLCPVRVIEDGEVRTVVESLFGYRESRAAVRISLPKKGTEIDLSLTVFNGDRDVKVKLSVPTALKNASLAGRTMFGMNKLPTDGREVCAQDYLLLSDETNALSVIRFGNYGLSCEDGTLRLTLLSSAAYTGHPVDDRNIMPLDRFSDRIDMGERSFRFVMNFSGKETRQESVEAESSVLHEAPFALSYFPTHNGKDCGSFFEIGNSAVSLSACRPSENGGTMFRFYNSLDRGVETVLSFKYCGLIEKVAFNGYGFKTFVLKDGKLFECDCLEKAKA